VPWFGAGPEARRPLRIPVHTRRRLAELAALDDAGALHPTLDRTFPFDQAPAALARVEQGHAQGKIVVTRSPAES